MSASGLFAGKAEQYQRCRTDYPPEVIEAALAAVQLTRTDVVADLGSGTGMLARWILERGNAVFGVEPDAGMRTVAERGLAAFGTSVTSVAGAAEATTLPDASVDVITVGNAFHYFDPARARAEADRILRPGGRALIVGHSSTGSALTAAPNPFMQEYLRFLESIASPEDWRFHQRDRAASSLHGFFAQRPFHEAPPTQVSYPFTWDALSGRFLSTSLAPPVGDPRRLQVLARLEALFNQLARDGTVEFQLGWSYAWGTLIP